MTLGWAIVIVMVLYLLDKHNLLKNTLRIVAALACVAALGFGIWYAHANLYGPWKLNREIRKAAVLHLCQPTTLPAGFDFGKNTQWIPVITPQNTGRCVDADKVVLEVPPNRIAKSKAEWEAVVLNSWKEVKEPIPADATIEQNGVQCPATLPVGYALDDPVLRRRCDYDSKGKLRVVWDEKPVKQSTGADPYAAIAETPLVYDSCPTTLPKIPAGYVIETHDGAVCPYKNGKLDYDALEKKAGAIDRR